MPRRALEPGVNLPFLPVIFKKKNLPWLGLLSIMSASSGDINGFVSPNGTVLLLGNWIMSRFNITNTPSKENKFKSLIGKLYCCQEDLICHLDLSYLLGHDLCGLNL